MDATEKRWEKRWRPETGGLDSAAWESVWDELTGGHPKRTVPRGTVLYEQGDPADTVIFLHCGQVQMECCHSSGKKRVAYTLFDGLPVGEEECMFGGPREFRAVCNTECQISSIPAEEFRRRVEQSHALAIKLFQMSARKTQVLCRLLVRDSFLDVGERAASFLIGRAKYYGRPEDGGVQITTRITHQELADHLGTSRVAVSQCLRELELRGLLEKRKGLFFLPDPEALKTWQSEIYPGGTGERRGAS